MKASREAVADVLFADGWDRETVDTIVSQWIQHGDYLFDDAGKADFVVGNPPYIRLEDVPDRRMQLYRKGHPSMVGRSDIYVGFFERGLGSLTPGGALGFICADRWMRNQYGRELRKLVADRFSMDFVATMHDVDAFEEQVSAYPAITILRNRPQGESVAVDTTKSFGADEARRLMSWIGDEDRAAANTSSFKAARLPHWFSAADSWPAGSPARLALLEDLNDRFPVLEETLTKVGIGVATGSDAVFLTEDETLVERDRLLPMAMVKDAKSGHLEWHGTHMVNPWDEDGELVDLDKYPRLRRLLALPDRLQGCVLPGQRTSHRKTAYVQLSSRVTVFGRVNSDPVLTLLTGHQVGFIGLVRLLTERITAMPQQPKFDLGTRTARPLASGSWSRPYTAAVESEPRVFRDTPAIDYAYEWLHQDLAHLHLAMRRPWDASL